VPHDLHRDARLLVVDDQEAAVDAVKRTLRTAGYANVRSTYDPRHVLAIYDEFRPDLLLLDLDMPHMDGLAVMRQLGSRVAKDAYFPVLILTGDDTPESKQAALSLGAKDFLVKPCDRVELRLRVENLLETRFLYLTLQAHNDSLEAAVRARTRELEEAQIEIASRLAIAAEFRDDETGQHSGRVGRLAALIAWNLKLPLDQVVMIGQAAPLHDVGKIGIPDAILMKKDRLTADELQSMHAHTTIGARILGRSRCALLRLAEVIALYHHERWDGTGYAKLKGEDIPLAARITAVADTFDAMTHDRRYRPALAVSVARSEIARHSGTQFDPRVVEAFLRSSPAELEIDSTEVSKQLWSLAVAALAPDYQLESGGPHAAGVVAGNRSAI
jgi:putative two-component system response regulator